MFNKFRKLSDVPASKPPASPLASLGIALKVNNHNNSLDVEKGEVTENGPLRDGIVSRGPTLSRVPENSSPTSRKKGVENNNRITLADPSRTIRVRMPDVAVPKGNSQLRGFGAPAKAPAMSKWGMFKKGDAEPSKPVAPKEQLPAPAPAIVPKAAPKVSKWGAFKQPKENLKKTESTDSGFLRSEQKLDEMGRTDSKEGSNNSATSSTLDQQLLASLMEIKVELKEEIEALSVKMSRLDDQIGDIIKFFSPDTSPYSSNVPSSNSSRVGSCSEVPIGSPQKSVGSPTKRTAIVLHVREQGDSSDSHDSAHSSGNEPRSSSVTSHGSNGSRHSSSGRRSPGVVVNYSGPTPVENPTVLNMSSMNSELRHQEAIAFTEIESPPSPENSNVSHF